MNIRDKDKTRRYQPVKAKDGHGPADEGKTRGYQPVKAKHGQSLADEGKTRGYCYVPAGRGSRARRTRTSRDWIAFSGQTNLSDSPRGYARSEALEIITLD